MYDSTSTGKPLSVLAFDYGTQRIGVAVGNSITRAAEALPVISNTSEAHCFGKIGKLIGEWEPDAIVVGLPLHPDGAEHEMTQRARRFGQQIEGQHSKPVTFVDERYSSVILERDQQYQGSLDSHSAALILEQFFRERS